MATGPVIMPPRGEDSPTLPAHWRAAWIARHCERVCEPPPPRAASAERVDVFTPSGECADGVPTYAFAIAAQNAVLRRAEVGAETLARFQRATGMHSEQSDARGAASSARAFEPVKHGIAVSLAGSEGTAGPIMSTLPQGQPPRAIERQILKGRLVDIVA